MSNKTRNIYIDLLKILAMLMVIVNHSMTIKGLAIFVNMAVPMFLVITGYNYTNSSENNNLNFKDNYSPKILGRKLKRIMIPYSVLLISQIVLFFSLNIVDNTLLFFVNFLIGGSGDGGYYTFLMLQVILLFPIIQYFIKKFGWKALSVIALIQFLFEIIINLFIPSSHAIDQTYRLTIFRQLLYVAFGCYAYYNRNKIMDLCSVAFICIGLMMYALYMHGIYKPTIFVKWTPTTMLFSLLPMGIVYFSTKSKLMKTSKCSIIALLSNSTYHIFLVQQTYFYIIRRIPFNFNSVLLNIIICFVLGLIFYLLEFYITKLVKIFILKNKKVNKKP